MTALTSFLDDPVLVLNRGYEPSKATEESLRTHAANYLADYKVSDPPRGAVVYLFRIR